MSATIEVHRNEVVSAITGVRYTTETSAVADACAKCGGIGVYRFSTFSDLRAHVLAVEQWQEDADDDNDCPEPFKSGRCDCDRCGGSGVFRGDGGLYRFTITFNGTLNP